MLSIIHFRELPSRERAKVARRLSTQWQKPRHQPTLNADAALMRELSQLRMMAFGNATDDWGITHNANIVMYPWALTDHEFETAYQYVATGQLPDDSKFSQTPPISSAVKTALDTTGSKLNSKAAALIEAWLTENGGRAVGAAMELKNLGPIALAIDITKQILDDKITAATSAGLKARYEWERVRRGRRHA